MHSRSLDETWLPMPLDGSMTTSLLRDLRLKQRNSIELGLQEVPKLHVPKGTELQQTACCPED